MSHGFRKSLIAALFLLLAPPGARAQTFPGAQAIPEPASLVKVSAVALEVPAGGSAAAHIRLSIQPGWHVNANPPALDYLIPTVVNLRGADGLEPGRPRYPTPHRQKLAFEETELLVYDGEIEIEVPIVASASATSGSHTLEGRVRFQACNDQVCLAPATVPFQLVVSVRGGAAQGSPPAADTTGGGGASDAIEGGQDPNVGSGPSPREGFSTAPPPGSHATSGSVKNRLEAALSRGGAGWFLALFVGGLLLNLTPCVFPMLGVTVSIFGARRKEPLPRVLTAAVLYVLGIAVTYSALGVTAALTGGLFGSALQSAWVSVGLGALLVALSLSMFGLYELQPPAWLLTRLGSANATSAFGLFLSGLAVGIIAAPCVGPFVVAVLAIIARRADALFGFQTMFALSLGLGSPYLFLATFSNLLQRLPRSGDWMVWVKKVLGVILASVGLFYLLLGLAPDTSVWVLPIALIAGGAYLGFVAKIAGDRPGFRSLRRAFGAAAAIAGVVVIGATPRVSVTFQPFDAGALQGGLSQGRAAMLDFSADWCVPCHELDHNTFTDARVRALAKSFLTYKIDLTRYDAPESEALRREYQIAGVPTIVFLSPDGGEIREARVEGFMPPEPFLERMRYVAERTGVAPAAAR